MSQVRVAAEGINGTVGGSDVAAQLYIAAMCSHPQFRMDREDFKVGRGRFNHETAVIWTNSAILNHSVVLDSVLR